MFKEATQSSDPSIDRIMDKAGKKCLANCHSPSHQTNQPHSTETKIAFDCPSYKTLLSTTFRALFTIQHTNDSHTRHSWEPRLESLFLTQRSKQLPITLTISSPFRTSWWVFNWCMYHKANQSDAIAATNHTLATSSPFRTFWWVFNWCIYHKANQSDAIFNAVDTGKTKQTTK